MSELIGYHHEPSLCGFCRTSTEHYVFSRHYRLHPSHFRLKDGKEWPIILCKRHIQERDARAFLGKDLYDYSELDFTIVPYEGGALSSLDMTDRYEDADELLGFYGPRLPYVTDVEFWLDDVSDGGLPRFMYFAELVEIKHRFSPEVLSDIVTEYMNDELQVDANQKEFISDGALSTVIEEWLNQQPLKVISVDTSKVVDLTEFWASALKEAGND